VTERTIRHLAKQLAGTFYEQAGGDLFGNAPEDRERSKAFRQTYPTWEHYKRGLQCNADGVVVKVDQPGWMYFVSVARARMVQMLQDPTKSHLHDAIYKALLEEHQKSTAPQAQELLQRRLGHGPTFA